MDPGIKGVDLTNLSKLEKFIQPSWKKGTQDASGKKLEGYKYLGRVLSNASAIISTKLVRLVNLIKTGKLINNKSIQNRVDKNIHSISEDIKTETQMLGSLKVIENLPQVIKEKEEKLDQLTNKLIITDQLVTRLIKSKREGGEESPINQEEDIKRLIKLNTLIRDQTLILKEFKTKGLPEKRDQSLHKAKEYFSTAETYERNGDVDKAIKYYQKAYKGVSETDKIKEKSAFRGGSR